MRNWSLEHDHENAVNGKGGGGGGKRREEALTITEELVTGTRLSKMKWRGSTDYH